MNHLFLKLTLKRVIAVVQFTGRIIGCDIVDAVDNADVKLAESWEVDGTSSPTTAQKTAHLITYTYGADGSCTSVSYPDNGNGVEQLKYTYNSQKQLTKITAELSDGRTRTVSEYTYTADGKVAVRKDYEDFAGTGSQYIQRTYTYDSFDRVLSMVYNEGSTSDTPEESHTYQYDKASRIIHEETSLNWTGQTTAESEVKDYTYDAKGQLTKSVLLDQNQVQTTTEYTYDTVGNRLKQVETLFAQNENKQLRKEETSYTYNGLDQLLTSQVQETTGTASASSVSSVVYSYDSNGNLTAAADSVKNTEIQYQYDSQGQMTGYLAKVNGTETCNQENSYNGDGQRILCSENGTETSYYYQNGTLLMTETGEGSLDSFYYLGVSGNPMFVMQLDTGNAGYYTFQKDAQGSTRVVIDSSGTCAEWYDYTDFGETTIHEEQEGFLNRIGYTGGVYDENTELYYLNARYYNPETGRFLTRDSYRGGPEKPETLHLYLYCANDPVNYVDPSGHSPTSKRLSLSDYRKLHLTVQCMYAFQLAYKKKHSVRLERGVYDCKTHIFVGRLDIYDDSAKSYYEVKTKNQCDNNRKVVNNQMSKYDNACVKMKNSKRVTVYRGLSRGNASYSGSFIYGDWDVSYKLNSSGLIQYEPKYNDNVNFRFFYALSLQIGLYSMFYG